MRLEFSRDYPDDYTRLPDHIQERVDKALTLLLDNPRHPSLRVKKMKGRKDIWEARITKGYRFTFQILGDAYFIRKVGPHNIEKNP